MLPPMRGAIFNTVVEYSTDSLFENKRSMPVDEIAANESLNFSVDILDLKPHTTYYFRLKSNYNSIDYFSEILEFKTVPVYLLITNISDKYTSTTAQISGKVVTYEKEITNVEFQYSTFKDSLYNSVAGTPTKVESRSRGKGKITATLNNLAPGTQYYFRLKANFDGQDVYGDIKEVTTLPEYEFNLYKPKINGNDVLLPAKVTSHNTEITDITFEYGTLEYENSIVADPSQVKANDSDRVEAIVSNIDTNAVYYLRLKAMQNDEIIYSEDKIFNLSNDNRILMPGKPKQIRNDTLILKGLFKSYNVLLSNIQFEYGTTKSLGSHIESTPSSTSANGTKTISASIINPLPNQTYYYRFSAIIDEETIYPDIYEYTMQY